MSRSILRRIGPALLACLIVAWALGFAWSWATFSSERYLPSMRAEYAAREGLLLLLAWYVPVQAVAIVTALSLVPRSRREQPLPFPKLAASAVVTLVVLAVAFFAARETIGVASSLRLAGMASRSVLAREYEDLGAKAEATGRWADAASYYARYLAIDSGNASIARRKLDADTRAAEQQASARTPTAAPATPPSGVDAASLLAKATYFYNRGDWYSAHFYASQAAAIDPRRTDAARLAARAREKIASLEPSAEDAAGRELYLAKEEAYAALSRGERLAAWYAFSRLAASHPNDPDIKQFLAESGRELAGEVFFTDEMEPASGAPGVRSLLFVNSSAADSIEVVWIGKLAQGSGTFAFDVEAIRWRRDGSVVWHFTAPYGELLSESGTADRLLLHAADRGDQRIQYTPAYLAGAANRPAAERELLTLGPAAEELPLLSLDRSSLEDVGIGWLWRLAGRLASFGRLREQVAVEFAMRAAAPLALLAISLAALAFGWALRARWSGRAPVVAWLVTPLAAAAIALGVQLFLHAHRVALAFVVLAAGLPAALVALGVIELVLIALALAALAGQTSS